MKASSLNSGWNLVKQHASTVVVMLVCNIGAFETYAAESVVANAPGFLWGDGTNGLKAGIAFSVDPGRSSQQFITIVVETSETNATGSYVAPPDFKLAQFELKDAAGNIVSPLAGKRLDAQLPQRIPAKDLPMTAETARRASMIKGMLLLPTASPVTFREVHIEDVFRIKHEGEYIVNICVALYRFSPDRKFVFRMDIPCVSGKVHLTPSDHE